MGFKKPLIRRLQGEPLLRSNRKPWSYLWEQSDTCQTCHMDFQLNQPLFRCYGCDGLVHYGCLMENSVSAKIPICYACASGSGDLAAEPVPDSHLNEDHLERIPDSEQGLIDEQAGQLPDPYLNPLEEIVLDTGVIPCSVHGYDHLSRDPTCEDFVRKLLDHYIVI